MEFTEIGRRKGGRGVRQVVGIWGGSGGGDTIVYKNRQK